MAKEKVKSSEEPTKGPTSQSILNGFLNETKGDHYNFVVEQKYQISTGSLLLDAAMGGHLEVPAILRFTGVSEGGKTSQSLLLMKNFLETVPKSRGFLAKAEGRLGSNIQEVSGIKFVDQAQDWVDGTCFVLKTNISEHVAKIIDQLIKTNPENIKYYFLVDSMDGLIAKGDSLKGFDESHKVASGAVITSNFLRQISLPLSVSGHVAALISQVRSTVKINPYEKGDPKLTNSSGGNALQHYADWIFEFQPGFKSNQIIEDGKIIGHWAKILFKKTTNESTGTEVHYPIKHGRTGGKSVWVEYEVAQGLIEWEFVKKAGAWININESLVEEIKTHTGVEIPKAVNGLEKLRTILEENKTVCQYLFDKLKVVIASPK